MTYGIEVTNNHGNIILSEKYGAFRLKSSGSASAGNTLSVGDDELFFARPASIPVAQTTMRIDVDSSGDISPNIDIDYLILERFKSLSIPSGAYGLNIYASNGDLNFSSEYLTQNYFNMLEINSDYSSLTDNRNYRNSAGISTPSVKNRTTSNYNSAAQTYWDLRASNLPGITNTRAAIVYKPASNKIDFLFSRVGPPVGYVQYAFGIVLGIEEKS